jgi:hypothetical protein
MKLILRPTFKLEDMITMLELVNFFHPTNNNFYSQADTSARQRTFNFDRKSILEK